MKILRDTSFALLALGCATPAPLSSGGAVPVPPARRESASDIMHGRAVADPYRWLENTSDQEVLSWATAQNDAAEGFAGASRIAELDRRLLALSDFAIVGAYQRYGGREFYLKGLPSSTHSGVFIREPNGLERRIAGLDPASTAPPTEDAYAIWPSPDGQTVLTLVRSVGSTWGQFRLYDAATGALVGAPIDGASVIAAGAAWLSDGSGFIYSVYDRDAESGAPANARVMRFDLQSGQSSLIFERISSGVDDRWVLTPYTANDARQVVIEARLGSSPTTRHFLASDPRSERAFREMFASEANRLLIGAVAGRAYFYSDENAARGRVVSVGLNLDGRETELIAEQSAAIAANSLVGGNAYGLFGDHIVLQYQENAQPELRVFDLSGRRTATIDLPLSGALWGGFTGDPTGNVAHYRFLGISEPSSVYALDLSTGERSLVTQPQLEFDPQDYVAERIWVEREPGVRVPVAITYRRGAQRERPLILYGYGAFGWSSFLWYQPHLIEWMDQGGAYAVVGMRGGGEFGAAWHEAGRGLNREVSINDYIAASEALIERGLTSRDTLIANGSSLAGGVVGAALIRRPDLYGAGLLDFPALDMVRYTRFGHAQYWTQELGSPDDEAAFNVLLGYSPYHILPERGCIPPVLVRPGERDATVTPAHAYKFVARAQAMQACDNPVLLDVMEGAGHNFGATSEQVAHSHAVGLAFLERVLPEARAR